MKTLLRNAMAIGLTLCSLDAGAQSTLNVRGVEYRVDTLFHAPVGPGTTQTHLHLTAESNPLHVFYLTVDLSTPGVSIRSLCATDKVAGTQTTSSMATSHTRDGLTYFAGTNGDFYVTAGTATNGTSTIGTPIYANIVDGEIYKSSNDGCQFTVDDMGRPYVSRLNFYTGTATLGDKVTLLKGVNVSSPDNGITLYTPRYWGSANEQGHAGACHQVTARLVEGDEFKAGRSFRLEVTSEPTTDGDTKIPADGFVIHGRGNSTSGCNTGADAFVASLHVGDIVTFDNRILNAAGQQIYPLNTVSGNPLAIVNGQIVEGDVARHPRTGIGYSEDGTKVIMCVVDGRSGASVGVQTSMLGDIMRYAGAYEALNIDGGGSSTLYVRELGTRNACSDGKERAVGNGIFAVLEAPEDNEVASIAFADFRRTVPFMGAYCPTIYAFNKYGKLINADFKDFTLSCEPTLGEINPEGNTLTAIGEGTHVLTASVGEAKATVLVTVGKGSSASARYPAVLLDTKRKYTAELTTMLDGVTYPILANAMDWSSDNAEVATVDETGLICGVAEGTANITGVADFGTVTIAITVQEPKAAVAPAVEPLTDNWTLSPTGMNSASVAAFENGIAIDYNIKTTRSAKLIAKAQKPIYSLPKAIRLRVNPADLTIKSIALDLRPNNDPRTITLTEKSFTKGQENVFEYKVDDIFDPNDIGIFPIELSSLSISPGGSASKDYHLEIPGIEAVYDAEGLSVEGITDDLSAAPFFTLSGKQLFLAPGFEQFSICDLNGRSILAANASSADLSHLPAGIYIITSGSRSAKITL